MKIKIKFLVIVAMVTHHCLANASDVQVEVFSAKAADVNSFIFFDSVGSLIVDTTRNSKEAMEVAKLARSHGVPKVIFITHGHPDHYLGMGALKREFPDAKILVASQQVKDDIISFAKAAEQGHWLDDEPLMKPKSEKNPAGFDYQSEIQILGGNTLELPGGKKIEVMSDFPATEAAHETALFSKELNSLFASDLVYNGVHLWLARGVDQEALKNWQTQLKVLKTKYSPLKVKVYPGHGKPSSSEVFDTDLTYMNDFIAIVKKSSTQEEAKSQMANAYPTWANADFILSQSIKNWFAILRK